MRSSRRRTLTRRELLRSMGSAALALPVLELFDREALAQVAPRRSKYAVFFYTPNGVNQNSFWPTGTDGAFTLSPTLMPLAPFKDKLLVLGPQLVGGTPRAGTGLAYSEAPPQHQAPICLTGRIGTGCTGQFCSPPGYGLSYLDQATAVNRIDGPSIDQVIAAAVQGDSPFSSLNFGLHPIGGDTPSDINYAADGTPLKRMETADEAWTRVFGNLATGGAADSAAQAAASLRKHTAVTDLLNARFGSLRPELGAHDRQVLDRHLTSLRAFEDRRAKLLMSQVSQQMACAQPSRAPVPTDEQSVRTGADTEKLSPFFMDMIATSFACNLTKVASVSFGYPGGGGEGGLRMPWLGFTDPLHAVSHHGGTTELLDKYRQMNSWIAGQVAFLMQKLAAIPTADGTLLDQTTLYWFNRHGDGDTHSNFALPNIILGGTGGYFKMGRALQLPATNPTKVLISIANAMGVDVPAFGQPAFRDTAPLSGLIA